MAQNDFIAFASGANANVESQGSYAAESAIANGFSSGLTRSVVLNKVLRQATAMAAAVASFISQNAGPAPTDVGDGETTASLEGKLYSAIQRMANGAAAPRPGITVTPSNGTVNFDLTAANVFEVNLNQNVTSSTFSGGYQGQRILVIVRQDATGGRSWVWPSSSTATAAVGTSAGDYSAQHFVQLQSGAFMGTGATTTSNS